VRSFLPFPPYFIENRIGCKVMQRGKIPPVICKYFHISLYTGKLFLHLSGSSPLNFLQCVVHNFQLISLCHKTNLIIFYSIHLRTGPNMIAIHLTQYTYPPSPVILNFSISPPPPLPLLLYSNSSHIPGPLYIGKYIYVLTRQKKLSPQFWAFDSRERTEPTRGKEPRVE